MDFQKEVIESSHELPVVVDFWAPWCGPCKVLGPVIEALAEEQKGLWSLVKVNSDDHPDISSQYKIKGIPAVKMFVHGDVIAEFTGSLPKSQIESWLEEHLPDERKQQLQQFISQFQGGNLEVSELQRFVDENPLDDALMLLAKATIFQQPDTALELFERLSKPFKYTTEIEDLKSLVELMRSDAEGSKIAVQIRTAQDALVGLDFDQALESLIESVMIQKDFCNELARRSTVGLFHYLGEQHELTKKHRRRFDMALY